MFRFNSLFVTSSGQLPSVAILDMFMRAAYMRRKQVAVIVLK